MYSLSSTRTSSWGRCWTWGCTSLRKTSGRLLKDYLVKKSAQLTSLIDMVRTDLTKGERQKVMCFITLDAHSRDIVENIIREDVEDPNSFQWQSQLRFRWDSGEGDCFINICDAEFHYEFEYQGNGPRLVITPLTDRIYVTATQALHLTMGCAPAGPAGTGKTETTKDLAAMMGKCIYVFNCSPEMDYRSMGDIFKGLAARLNRWTRSWTTTACSPLRPTNASSSSPPCVLCLSCVTCVSRRRPRCRALVLCSSPRASSGTRLCRAGSTSARTPPSARPSCLGCSTITSPRH
mmetsp:Transcript_35086/g.75904  ORF Transcript_35086/g.75904 Transcript_35086/m.75904 type:complete len:292 (-) Transcript_35086:573-1448(-)